MRYEFEVDLKPVWHKPPPTTVPVKGRIPPIRRALVLAYQVREYMTAHKVQSLTAFCRLKGITPARVSQILSLLQLSCRIQEQIILENSVRLYGLSEYVIRPLMKEVLWETQEELWKKCVIVKDDRRNQLVKPG